MSIKEQVSKSLESTGKLSSGDIGSFMAKGEEHDTSVTEYKLNQKGGEDIVIKSSLNLEDDLIMGASSSNPSNTMQRNLNQSGTDILQTAVDYTKVVITEEDKNKFLDCMVGNTRFTSRFSTFGGRVTGTIRSRTSDESRAIINEVTRRLNTGEVRSDSDYSSIFRRSVLRFQIDILNNVHYPSPEGQLIAVATFMGLGAADNAEPPKWYTEACATWGTSQPGLESAIYAEVMKFEHKYWTMVNNCSNQDFWNPED